MLAGDNTGLNTNIRNKIIELIISHKEVNKIVLFGSRANNTANKTSDIDIAIFSEKWSRKDINLVKNLLENEIKTPLKFDLLNFDTISKISLKKDIIKEGKILYESKKN
ncbi:MAG: hypothetical protein ACD_79C00680G0004 [uncultured bacterium]|nr:MAG: hypothetical protein ACD_79C00680G0004 [uncultured bacterium]